MYEYMLEAPKMVSLKGETEKTSGLTHARLERLISIIGDIQVSEEFVKAYLAYYSFSSSHRENSLFMEDSLRAIHQISIDYPMIGSKGLVMIMGEYVKDLFEELHPLSFFDGMTLREMDDSFERFMELLKMKGKESDEPYIKDAARLDELSKDYGTGFIEYVKKMAIRYHKSYDEVLDSLADPTLIKKDCDEFFEIAKSELFGYSSYPYSYQMTQQMLLFGDCEDYRKEKLEYVSTRKGRFLAPFTGDEFYASVLQRRKK